MAAIDVTSADPILTHDGSALGALGAPARDLSGNDVARLAYKRAFADVTERVGQPIDPDDPDAGVVTRPDPRSPDPAIVEAVMTDLVASGRYSPVEAKSKKAKAEAHEAAEQAAAEAAAKAAESDTPPDQPAETAEKPEA